MEKKQVITIVIVTAVIGYLTGGIVSAQVQAKQSRDIWRKVTTLLEQVNFVIKEDKILKEEA